MKKRGDRSHTSGGTGGASPPRGQFIRCSSSWSWCRGAYRWPRRLLGKVFSMTALSSWITIVLQIVGLVVIAIGGLWAYSKYVCERGLFAPTQITVEAASVGSVAGATILEVLLHLKNVGSSTLIAHNIRMDIRYLNRDDNIETFDDVTDFRFGRMFFKHSLRENFLAERVEDSIGQPYHSDEAKHPRRSQDLGRVRRGFLLLDYATFVQAGVDQVYDFTTRIPDTCRYVLVWASFEYAQKPRPLQVAILAFSRRLGLIQYTLQHATIPHTVERVFKVGDL